MKKINPYYRKLSNAIDAAGETGNAEELRRLGEEVHVAMLSGRLTIQETADLTADIDIFNKYADRAVQAEFSAASGFTVHTEETEVLE